MLNHLQLKVKREAPSWEQPGKKDHLCVCECVSSLAFRMCEIQLLRALVTERLAVAADEIFGLVEQTIAEFRDEVLRSKSEIIELREELNSLKTDMCTAEPNQDHSTDGLFPLQNKGKHHQRQSQIKEEAMEVITPRLEDEASHGMNSPHDQTEVTAYNQAPSSDCPVIALINKEDDNWNPCLEEHQVVRDHIPQERIKEEVKEVMIPRIEDEAYPSVKSHYDQSVVTADNQALFSEYSSTALGSQLVSSPLHQSRAGSYQADRAVPASFEYLISAKVSVDTICDVCGKRCGSKNGLTEHLQTHPEVKFCHVCCACFKKDIDLIRHMEGNHEGEKPFKCHDCGKAFLRIDNLVMHVRIHTGEKPFGCPFCGKSFAQSSYLSIHKRIHTGEKPYCCRVCGKSYSKSASANNCLREHRCKNGM